MALWTPANLAAPFDAICDCRSVTWSGSDWSSQPNDGSAGGSFSNNRASAPVQGTASNSITPIQFDGNKGLKLASLALTSSVRYVFWVAKTTSTGRNTIVAMNWNTVNGEVWYIRDSEISGAFRGLSQGINGYTTSSDAVSTNLHIGNLKWQSGATVLKINGVSQSLSQVNSGVTTGSDTADFFVGESGPSFGPEGWVGDIFYAAIADTMPSDDEKERLEGWASWTFAGDGSLLPVGHTYKSAAPTDTSDQTVTGALYSDTDTFNAATVTLGLTGALFADGDTFYGSTLFQPINGALFTDTDTFYASSVRIGVGGALFADTDTFYASAVRLNVTGALFSNSNTFYGAQISGSGMVGGGLYVDPDTFPSAQISQVEDPGAASARAAVPIVRRRRKGG